VDYSNRDETTYSGDKATTQYEMSDKSKATDGWTDYLYTSSGVPYAYYLSASEYKVEAGDKGTVHPDGTVENGFLGLHWKKTEWTSGGWSKLSDGFLEEFVPYGSGLPIITLVPNAAAQRTIDWVEAEWDRVQDDVLDGLQLILTVASIFAPPGVSTALGLINLGISYARGDEITPVVLIGGVGDRRGGEAGEARGADGEGREGGDGKPVELHHRNQNPNGPLDELSDETHKKVNHSLPSTVDRGVFAGQRRRYWIQRVRELLGQA
jgi:hypothetical protein